MHIRDEDLVSKLNEQLEDETLLAAAFARIDTALSPARMLTPLANYLIVRPAARKAAKKATAATDVPLDAAMVFGLSDKALHVWKADPMLNQVHDHIGEVALDRITGVEVTPGRKWQPTKITLDDGSAVEVESRGAAHAIASEFDKLKKG